MDPAGMTLLVGIGMAIVAFFVFVLIFRWIWNGVVPNVFGLKTITFWQALGILILASILFGGHRVISTDMTSSLPKRSDAPSMTKAA
jgi:hypothetical protein